MRYLNDFREAAMRTPTLGVHDSATKEMLLMVLQGGEHPEYRQIAVGLAAQLIDTQQLAPDDVAIRCIHVHVPLWIALIDDGIPAVLTLGDVIVDGTPLFNVTEEGLADELRRPDPDAVLQLHAWLTFPGLALLDATLLSRLTPPEGRPEAVDNVASLVSWVPAESDQGHAEVVDLQGDRHDVRWVPFLFGSKYLDLTSPAAMPTAPLVAHAIATRRARSGG